MDGEYVSGRGYKVFSLVKVVFHNSGSKMKQYEENAVLYCEEPGIPGHFF